MQPFEGARVVLWADQACELESVGEVFTRLGCRVEAVGSLAELRAVLGSPSADLIAVRACGCSPDPLEILRLSERAGPLPPVLIFTTGLEIGLYLEAMTRGAFDCIGLPLDEKELIRIASRALSTRRAEVSAYGGE